MADQDILTKAIEQAGIYESDTSVSVERRNSEWIVRQYRPNGMPKVIVTAAYSIIFNKDFAKAFWGTQPLLGHKGNLQRWEFYLPRQVVSDDPVRYLEKGLK